MKTIKKILFISAIILLASCSGSDTYRGNWKATNVNGDEFEITFEAKKFIITNNLGETKEYGYSQNSVNIKNSVETYGINVDDGRSYKINFPIANDESKGIMMDGNGYLIYTISRDDYISYDNISKLD